MTETESMVVRVAKAIDAVQIWSRRNDLLDPHLIEVCRYGLKGEPEIIVLETADWNENEDAVLHAAVSKYRARAVLDAMKTPTPGMVEAGYGYSRPEDSWFAMIVKALEE